jgi:hypothetical protein
MRSGSSTTIALTALALASGAGALALRAHTESLRPRDANASIDVPPLPAEVARPFAFGMRSLAADLTFLETIQVHGARKNNQPEREAQHDDRLQARLLTYTTNLDEKFAGAYRYAGTTLPRHTLDGKAYGVLDAWSLLRKGARERPDDWKIAFELGFIEAYYLGQMADAAEHLAAAARQPHAPAYLGLLATRLAADAGDLGIAQQMAETMAAEASDDEARQDWTTRLLDLKMERTLRAIDAAAKRYQVRTGARPPSVEALLAAQDLPPLPPEPHGGRFVLDPYTGEARSTAAQRLRFRGRREAQSGMEVH